MFKNWTDSSLINQKSFQLNTFFNCFVIDFYSIAVFDTFILMMSVSREYFFHFPIHLAQWLNVVISVALTKLSLKIKNAMFGVNLN